MTDKLYVQHSTGARGGRYGQYVLSRCVQSYIGVNVYNLNTVIV